MIAYSKSSGAFLSDFVMLSFRSLSSSRGVTVYMLVVLLVRTYIFFEFQIDLMETLLLLLLLIYLKLAFLVEMARDKAN